MFVYIFEAKNRDLSLLFDDEATVKAILERYTLYWNESTEYFQCYSKTDKTAPPTYLQRVIGNVPKGLVGDHENGNLYDFRGVNIEAITQEENCQKQQKTLHYAGKPTSSKHKGNCLDKRSLLWYAYIRVKGVLLNLGYYANPCVAAMVYNIYAMLLFKKHKLNEVEVTNDELAVVDFTKLNQNARKNLIKHGKLDVAAKLAGLV